MQQQRVTGCEALIRRQYGEWGGAGAAIVIYANSRRFKVDYRYQQLDAGSRLHTNAPMAATSLDLAANGD